MDKKHFPTLIDRLYEHAASMPDKASYIYLRDDATRETISFRELKKQVEAVATSLADRIAPGECVMLLFPAGLEFIVAFLASLAAGLIAVPAHPPRRNRSVERLHAILCDATPAMILAGEEDGALAESLPDGRSRPPIFSLADLERDGTVVSRVSEKTRTPIAFLQYTSGSTGRPRGVVVTQANLAFNESQIEVAFHHTSKSLVVSWLPLFHDMGLVGCVLQSLYVGFTSVLISPISFLLEPARWLRTVTDYRATTTGAPNFAYDLCARTVHSEQKKELDLSSVRVAFNGSEPVSAETIERFVAAFSDCGFKREAFFPCYGLAESTLFVSGGPAGSGPRTIWVCSRALERHEIHCVSQKDPSARCFVSSGQVAGGTEVLIVDPDSKSLCPSDTAGEIWIHSDSVAAGYWSNVRDTQQTFGVVLPGCSGKRYLRTGDTGFVDGGDLFVVGRIKDVIIVRGRNIYPQDVEILVERELGSRRFNCVAAFGMEADDGEEIAVVVEGDRKLSGALQIKCQNGCDKTEAQAECGNEVAALVDRIRERVSENLDVALHSIYFVKLGTFPRTSSGKLRRRACKAAAIAGTLELLYESRVGGVSNCQSAPKTSQLE